MLFDEDRPVKKPVSIWEFTKILANINDRRSELLCHRGEAAGGDFIWTSEDARKEYVELGKKRKAVMAKLFTARLD